MDPSRAGRLSIRIDGIALNAGEQGSCICGVGVFGAEEAGADFQDGACFLLCLLCLAEAV